MDYTEIVREFAPGIYNNCFRMMQHIEEAEDLTQEIFLKIYQNLGKFKRRSKLKTWIYRIVVNTCLTRINSRKHRTSTKNFCDLDEAQHSPTSDQNPEDVMINAEKVDQLERALLQIPQAERQILLLFYFEGFSYKEISTIMSLPTGTVCTKLFRARQKLRTKYCEVNK